VPRSEKPTIKGKKGVKWGIPKPPTHSPLISLKFFSGKLKNVELGCGPSSPINCKKLELS
jgi:hypothetical protein